MKLELKELFCVEWEFNREIQLTAHKSYSVTAYIGPAGTEQAEGFIITVCNLDYIKQVIAQQEFFDGRWHVVMENPTKDNIIKYLQRILPCEYFKDWTEAYQKLRLIGRSEFEDYKDCRPGDFI